MKPKTKLSPLQKIAMAMFVMACLAVFAIFRFLDYPVASWQLNREYERAKKNGIPLTQADLKPKGIDEKQNAAPELERIGKAINRHWKEIYHAKRSQQETLRVKYCQPYLEAFYKENAKQDYCTQLDFDLGMMLETGELSGFHILSRALSTLAIQDAKEGRWTDALAKVKNLLLLAQHLESCPVSWYQNSSVNIGRRAFQTIEQLAEDNASDSTHLVDLLRLVNGFIPKDHTKEAILSDCYLIVATLRNTHWFGGAKAFVDYNYYHVDPPDPGTEPKVVKPTIRSGKPNQMIARALMAKTLAFHNDAVSSNEWRNNDFKGLATRMAIFADRHVFENTHRVSDRLNYSLMMPEFRNSFRPYLRVVAAKRAAGLVLRSLLFKLQYSSFPKNLRQVSADITDPYLEGQNLHYKSDGKSVAIWSVGSNLIDDGGHKEKGNDIGAYYPAYKPVH